MKVLKLKDSENFLIVNVNSKRTVTNASSIQIEIYRDGGRYFHWPAIENVWSISPFVDSLLSRTTKARIALHHMHTLYRALLRDESLHHHIPFDPAYFCALRIGRHPVHD